MPASITVHLVATLVPVVIGIVYGWMIKKSIMSQWYSNLKKPCFHPPGWLIPIAFAVVNALMGYASGLICGIEESSYHYWNDSNEGTLETESRTKISHLHKLAIIAYLIQFALNGIWPIIFFITENIVLALIQIIIVDAATIFCSRLFYESSPLAGLLSLPYLMWLAVWTLIIFSLWIMNGDSKGSYEKLLTKGTMTPHFMTQVSITQVPTDHWPSKAQLDSKGKSTSNSNSITGSSESNSDTSLGTTQTNQDNKVINDSRKKKSKRRKQETAYYGSLMV